MRYQSAGGYIVTDEGLNSRIAAAVDQSPATQANLDAMLAQLNSHDALVKDAQRYRWLRNNRVFKRPHDRDGPGYTEVRWDWSPYRGDPETLDAAIDAAMLKDRGQ